VSGVACCKGGPPDAAPQMLRSRKGALSPKSLRSPSAVVLEAQTAAPWTGGRPFALGSARIPACCSRHPAGNVREHDQYRLSPRSRGSGSCKLCAASMERASPAGDCPPRPATPKPSARCRRRHAGSARSPLTSEHRGGEVRLCCHQKKLGDRTHPLRAVSGILPRTSGADCRFEEPYRAPTYPRPQGAAVCASSTTAGGQRSPRQPVGFSRSPAPAPRSASGEPIPQQASLDASGRTPVPPDAIPATTHADFECHGPTTPR
jgi:hypothetical protein